MRRLHNPKPSDFCNTSAPRILPSGPESARDKTTSGIQAACAHPARTMYNYHYDQETLLITDVTRLQPFTVGGDSFRQNIETLVSYNVRTDRIQQDCLYIEQGHLMMPTMFMTYSMAIDPRQTVVVTWTLLKMYSMLQGSQPSSRPGSPLYTSS